MLERTRKSVYIYIWEEGRGEKKTRQKKETNLELVQRLNAETADFSQKFLLSELLLLRGQRALGNGRRRQCWRWRVAVAAPLER
jgi:hypothetical protein